MANALEAGKSGYVYANSLEEGCFGCGYCVLCTVPHLNNSGLPNGFNKLEIGVPPTQIDPRMANIPVEVNNALGDPLIQWEDTLKRLETLVEYGHKGVVLLITKGVLSPEKASALAQIKQNLNLVVLLSISGLKPPIEPGNLQGRLNNISILNDVGIPTIGYLRPIIPGYNDDPDLIRQLLDCMAEKGLRYLSFAGLMGKEPVINQLEQVTHTKILPPQPYNKWSEESKLISPSLVSLIESYAASLGIFTFRKTSCAVTVAGGLDKDYNLNMYKPDKYNCAQCINKEKCLGHQDPLYEPRVESALEILEAEGNIEFINGISRLVLQGAHTMGEVALARWLATLQVIAEHTLSTTMIPDKWRVTSN